MNAFERWLLSIFIWRLQKQSHSDTNHFNRHIVNTYGTIIVNDVFIQILCNRVIHCAPLSNNFIFPIHWVKCRIISLYDERLKDIFDRANFYQVYFSFEFLNWIFNIFAKISQNESWLRTTAILLSKQIVYCCLGVQSTAILLGFVAWYRTRNATNDIFSKTV